MKALVIGGTGPTGPLVVKGLIARGYEVTILHRGVHEPDDLPPVRHLHADPHFAATLSEALDGSFFHLVIAMYGRLAQVGEVLVGHCERLIGISGLPVYRGYVAPESVRPYGMRLMADERSPLATDAANLPRFARLVVEAERSLLDRNAKGDYAATTVRYSQIYGPRAVVNPEWAVVKRVDDGRRQLILPDDGLWVLSRCAAENAASLVLSIVDRPDVAQGQSYNCADDDQYTVRQWAEIVLDLAGGDLELVGIPSQLAGSALSELLAPGTGVQVIVDTTKARRELGYRDAVPARQALGATVDWLRQHPPTESYPGLFDYAREDRLIALCRSAWASIREQVLDERPVRRHLMAHPDTPSLLTDEHGR